VLISQVLSPEPRQAAVIPLEQKEDYDRLNDGEYTRIRNYM
jgi:hypothetical protein